MKRRVPVLLIAALVAVVLIVRGGERDAHVEAVFADVRGLVPGAPVRESGVPVGRVDAIRLGSDGLPHVRLSVDDTVRAGTRAEVRMWSLSGEFNRYVALTPGTGRPLRDGAVLRNTRSAVEVDDALSALDPRTRAEVRAVLSGARATLAGSGPAIDATLAHSGPALDAAAGLAEDVSADGAALTHLVSATRTITGALAARPAATGAAVASVRRALRVAAGRQRELATGVRGMPGALVSADAALGRARALLPAALRLVDAAAPVAGQLPGAANELAAATSAAGPALRSARAGVAAAPAGLRALAPLLRRAAPVLEQLVPALRRSGPMLDQLRVRLPDAFSFFANWADFTANYDANGHGARVGIVLPPAPTKTLAPSSDGAGQLRPPYLRTPGSLEGEPWNDYAKSFVAGGKAAEDAK